MRLVVVGGGISGLFLSYYLLKDGHEVLLADAPRGSVKTSAYNAGQLSTRPSYTDIFGRSASVRVSSAVRRSDKKWFGLARRQRREAYERVGIPLSLRSLALYEEFFASERADVDLVEEVLDLHKIPASRPEGRPMGAKELDELGYTGFAEGYLVKEKSLHSEKLLAYLKARTTAMGARFLDGRVRLRRSGSRIGSAVVDGEDISADAYVVAAGSWSGEVCKPLGYDPMVIPARGLVLFYRTGMKRVVEVPAHYEDEGLTVTQHDADTLRLTSFFELAGFVPRFPKARRDWLFRAATSHFSRGSSLALAEMGVGFRPSTPDQLPLVGRIPGCGNGYILSGSCRKGMALAPLLGKLLAGLVSGGSDPDLSALDPSRFGRTKALSGIGHSQS